MATTASTSTVTRVLAEEIAGLGISTVFTLMGEDTAALVTVLGDEHGLDVVTTRHESAAVMGADAYAWATSAACASSGTGPGTSTASTPPGRARRQGGRSSSSPETTPTGPESRPDEAVHQAVLARALGVEYVLVEAPEQASGAFRAAVASARGGRPAVVGVRVDVLHRPVESPPAVDALPDSPPGPVPDPSARDVARIAEVIAVAKRPLVVAGRGAIHAKDDLLLLAERIGALVGTSLLARDLFRGHRLDVGVVGGWASDPVRPLSTSSTPCWSSAPASTRSRWPSGTSSATAASSRSTSTSRTSGRTTPCTSASSPRAARWRGRCSRRFRRSARELHGAETLALLQQPLYLGEDESSDDS